MTERSVLLAVVCACGLGCADDDGSRMQVFPVGGSTGQIHDGAAGSGGGDGSVENVVTGHVCEAFGIEDIPTSCVGTVGTAARVTLVGGTQVVTPTQPSGAFSLTAPLGATATTVRFDPTGTLSTDSFVAPAA